MKRCTYGLPTVALALAATLAARGAEAHAFLRSAQPNAGAVIKAAPSIRLTFSEKLVAAFCRVTVAGPPGFGGASPAHAVPGQPATLVVDLKRPAPPGTYLVRWRVLSADTHVSEGNFRFQVRP